MLEKRLPDNEKLKTVSVFGIIFLIIFLILFILAQRTFEEHEKIAQLAIYPLPQATPIWERKIENPGELKIGIITDTHIRPTRISRLDKTPEAERVINDQYLEIFNNFNFQMGIFGPDFLVHLGDVIEGTGDPDYVGLSGIKLVDDELRKNNVPIFWVVGNHDLRSVSKEQFRTVLGLENLEYIKDWEGYRLIFLDGNFNPNNKENNFVGEGYIPGFVHPDSLIWLENNLKTDKRVLVFMHQSVMDSTHESRDDTKSSVDNAKAVRDILEKYRVEAVFNGHIEVLHKIEERGVKYYSLAGTKKSSEYPESYYEVNVNGYEITVKVFYKNKKQNKVVEKKL